MSSSSSSSLLPKFIGYLKRLVRLYMCVCVHKHAGTYNVLMQSVTTMRIYVTKEMYTASK